MVLDSRLLRTYRIKARGELQLCTQANVDLPHDVDTEMKSFMPLLKSVDTVRLAAQAPGCIVIFGGFFYFCKKINR